ncbi:MAG: hypothetical protein PHX24_03650 [Acidithiobacillus sp.]|nr:hypothetical protein [Acidithiobacillus sp.]
MDSESQNVANKFKDVPTENLVDTILRSHTILSKVHEDELQAVRDRSIEMTEGLRSLEAYRDRIQEVIKDVQAVTKEQTILVSALKGRHQDFLENFDKKSATIMDQVAGKHLALLKEKSEEINKETAKQFRAIVSQLAASLQMEMDGVDKKVKDVTSNSIHDLNAFSTAVRSATKAFHEQSVKMYGRVLLLSLFGAFAGTVSALILLHFMGTKI